MITGHDRDRSVVAADEELEEINLLAVPGVVLQHVWASPATPTLPYPGRLDPGGPYFPRAGGVRVVENLIPPQSTAAVGKELTPEAVIADMEEKMPGVLEHFDPEVPGMHASETVDVGMVKSGEIWLVLDDDVEVQLRTGDYFVQNGTNHRWENRSDVPCVLTVVLIGANAS